MGLFNQKKDTVEWIEYRPDLLFYKWKNREIKKGSRLVIRAGQKAIFYSGGRIHGIFENEGTYDIDTQIIPFLTDINAALHLRSDTGERAEVYFVNSKELTTADVLLEEIDNGKVGDTLTLTLCRISSNYQTSEFNVKVKLVEDTGNTASVNEQTTSSDQFFNPFGN